MGTSLDFTASTSTINCGTNSVLNATDDVSFAFWFKFTSPHRSGSARKYVFRKDRPYIVNFHPDGSFEFAIRNASSYQAMTTTKVYWEPNQWHHITAVNSAVNGRTIYLDGVSIRTGSAVTPAGNSSTLFLGASDGAGADFFNGFLDDMRIYTRELSAAEAMSLYQTGAASSTSLVAWYKFDEGTGSTANDSSGNGNTGTITGAIYSEDAPVGARSVA